MSNTDVLKALQALTNQLGVACGGEPGHDATRIGQSVMGAQSQIHEPSQMLAQQGINGQAVIIGLVGDAQPEGARVLNSALNVALKAAGEPDAKRAGSGTRRHVIFALPGAHIGAFTQELQRITKTLERTHGLKKQCRRGIEVSLNSVNIIPGTKPHVEIAIPPVGKEEPHFTLHIEGVPETLAKTLQETMGLSGRVAGFGSAFAKSGEVFSRDLKEKSQGGRTVDIPLNAPYTDKALQDIADYARAMGHVRQFPPGQHQLPG